MQAVRVRDIIGVMRISEAAFEGCLIGHALGDALGAPVEFATDAQIIERFGPGGVREPEPWGGHPAGTYTDDTQMMLATAAALLDVGELWAREQSADPAQLAWDRYLAWRARQDEPGYRRSPGLTCLNALAAGRPGGTFEPINDSKGAGGIMRVSPVGLVFEPGTAFEIAVDLAALTHGHPTGYLAAGVFADVVSRVTRGTAMRVAIAEAREELVGWDDDAEETLSALDQAVELFVSDVHPAQAARVLGEGWVAEEALGIALHCALSYPRDWSEGTLAAVNITGDSDTTGCLTGALLGASLGREAIPGAWIAQLEDSDEIVETSAALWRMVEIPHAL